MPEEQIELPPCDRCEKELKTADDLGGAMLLYFSSPLMPTPSPPTFLCRKCALATAKFSNPRLANSPALKDDDDV